MKELDLLEERLQKGRTDRNGLVIRTGGRVRYHPSGIFLMVRWVTCTGTVQAYDSSGAGWSVTASFCEVVK